jgi:hypothetical protein
MQGAGGALWKADLLRPEGADERRVYEAFRESGLSVDLAALVQVILDYERVSRTLHEAFHAVLRCLEAASPRSAGELHGLQMVQFGAEHIQGQLHALFHSWEAWVGTGASGSESGPVHLNGFLEVHSPASFLVALQAHHSWVQKGKGTRGKMRWLERDDGGRFHVSLRGRSVQPAPDRFVHGYRCAPVYSFLQSLDHV